MIVSCKGLESIDLILHWLFNTVIGAPVIIQAKVINKTNVALQWTHPNGRSDIVLNYQIIYYGYKIEKTLGVMRLLHVLSKKNVIFTFSYQITKAVDKVSIVDATKMVSVEGKSTSFLIKDLISGLTYSITVSQYLAMY